MGGGQPALFQEYWESSGGEPCSSIASDFQTEYQGRIVGEGIYKPLEEEIRRLHANVGNAETEGYTVVLGVGGTGVMNSVLYALASLAATNATTSSGIYAQPPYYGNYLPQTQNTMAYSSDSSRSFLEWETQASSATHEIITYPNNPDGVKRSPTPTAISSTILPAIYDAIYYWPQFTSIDRKLSEDVMIFSASKHTGHAGSRLGWALVKNPEVAELMRNFVQRELGVSMDSQIRYTYTLNFINEQFESTSPPSSAFYEFSQAKMKGRFDAVAKLFVDPESGELVAKRGVTFLNNDTRGAYIWLVHDDANVDLQALLQEEAMIAGSGGQSYGVAPNYARIQLMARSVEVNDMLERLEGFLDVSEKKEDDSKIYSAERWTGVKRSNHNQGGC
jgi:L-tryptophan--pyruvate aminotransferase